jgi:signal transduction histidine kinase/ligand-binding sensor domain-containing protein
MRIRTSSLIVAILLSSVPSWALDPALGLHQYAHASWRFQNDVKGYPRSLAQTQDGYLWLGTDFGLFQFDGVKFMAWIPPAGMTLPDSAVVRLLGTRDGGLWIGTEKGLALWKNHSLTRFESLEGHYVAALIEDRHGDVWVGTSAGFVGTAKLCSIRQERVSCAGADGTFGRFITALFEDINGRLWVGAATGLWQWRPVFAQVHKPSGPYMEIHSIRGDSTGGLLVAFNRDIRRLSHGALTDYYSTWTGGRPFKPSVLLQDRDGGTWIGTQDQGVLRIHGEHTNRFSRSDGLSGAFVTDLFEDREGNIWLATLTGLDRFHQATVTTISSREGLSSNVTASVLATSDGAVWFGTDSGLDRWKDGHMSHRRMHAGSALDVVGSLFEDSRGRLWASSQRGLVVIENGQARPIAGFPGGYMHAIAEDARGDIWIADQERGLHQLRDERIVALVPSATLGGRTVRSLAADPAGDGLWIGFFQGGVAHFKDGRIEASYGIEDRLARGEVNSLRFDRKGALWVSAQGGLTRLSSQNIATISTANGLPCDAVHWSIEDDSHSMWVYTTCGLARIAPAEIAAWLSDTTRVIPLALYNHPDGVASAFLGGSYGPKVAKSTDGRLWFATLDGIGVVDPRQGPFNSTRPPVHIVRVQVDNRNLEPEHEIRFPSPVRDLRIDYTALSLSAPEKLRFRYKLEGRDTDWIEAGNRRQAFYTDLAPATYRFRVIASNNNDIWNENAASWEFSLLPAFYQTTQFRVSLTLGVVAALVLLYRFRLRHLAAQLHARFEERIDERTRIAQELHDTLLQGFISTSMHLHLLADELADSPVRPKLDRILERVRSAIDEGRAAVCGLRTRPRSSEALEHSLGRDAKDFRGGRHTAYRIVVEGKPRPLEPFIRDEIYRISREALANAFRHSKATQIDVMVEYAASRLRIQVCDNGMGLIPEQLEESGHWGLRGMRERAHRIGAKLQILSRINGGTEVLLVVPGCIAFHSVSVEPPAARTESSDARV